MLKNVELALSKLRRKLKFKLYSNKNRKYDISFAHFLCFFLLIKVLNFFLVNYYLRHFELVTKKEEITRIPACFIFFFRSFQKVWY